MVLKFIELHYVGWNNSYRPNWIAYYISLADVRTFTFVLSWVLAKWYLQFCSRYWWLAAIKGQSYDGTSGRICRGTRSSGRSTSARNMSFSAIYLEIQWFGHAPPPANITLDAVVKVVLWSRGGSSPDEARLEQIPYTFQPTNLALFRHKITLYRFNQGHTIAGGGLKWEQGGGAEPPHFNYCLDGTDSNKQTAFGRRLPIRQAWILSFSPGGDISFCFPCFYRLQLQLLQRLHRTHIERATCNCYNAAPKHQSSSTWRNHIAQFAAVAVFCG